jgi:oligosaccharide repeat unit polymerase
MVKTHSLGQQLHLTRAFVAFLFLALLGSWVLVMAYTPNNSDNLRIMLLLVSIAFLVIGLGPMLAKSAVGQTGLFDCRNLFLLSFSVFSLAYPLGCVFDLEGTVQLALANSFGQLDFPLSVILKGLLLCLIGLLSFRLASTSKIGESLACKLPPLPSRWYVHKAYAIVYLYMVVGVMLYVKFIQNLGGFSTYLNISYGGNHESYLADQGEGPLKFGFLLIEVALVMLYGITRRFPRTSRPHLFIFYPACAAFVMLTLTVGRRSHAVALGLSLIALRHFLVKRLSGRFIASILLVGFLLMNAFSYVRGSLSLGPREAYREVEERFKPGWFIPTDNYYGSPYLFAMGDILEAVPSKVDYLYGRSYINTLEIFVPKALLPERSLSGSQWYAATFHPIAFSLGYGFGFFVIAEAYLNFGVVGPFVVLFGYGVLFSTLYHYFVRHKNNFGVLLTYCLLLPLAVTSMNDGFDITAKTVVLFTGIPVAVLVLLASDIRRPKTSSVKIIRRAQKA